MDNIVYISKNEVNQFLKEVKKIKRENIRVIKRIKEMDKDPNVLLEKLEYDVNDMIEEIKKLTIQDFIRCQIDSKNKFMFMYSLIKNIKEIIVFIKLSIVKRNDEILYVISFHKAKINELQKRPYR